MGLEKKIAIMQPTFLPWMGYFGLINIVDEFIILDDVQFDRRSWQQRNRICHNNGDLLLTVPVNKTGKFEQLINEVKVSKDWVNYRRKMLTTIRHAYSKSKFFEIIFPELTDILCSNESFLSLLNQDLINWGCKLLQIPTPLVRASTLKADGKRTDYLIKLCKVVDGTVYISPQGSKTYLENDTQFEKNNIKLKYFIFKHPMYEQLSDKFVYNLSFIDALFNIGPEKMRELIQISSDFD